MCGNTAGQGLPIDWFRLAWSDIGLCKEGDAVFPNFYAIKASEQTAESDASCFQEAHPQHFAEAGQIPQPGKTKSCSNQV